MKQSLINYMQKEKNDEYYTPNEAIYPILKYLDKNKTYWECTDFGKSNITKVLKENGFNVISTNKEKLDYSSYFLQLIIKSSRIISFKYHIDNNFWLFGEKNTYFAKSQKKV